MGRERYYGRVSCEFPVSCVHSRIPDGLRMTCISCHRTADSPHSKNVKRSFHLPLNSSDIGIPPTQSHAGITGKNTLNFQSTMRLGSHIQSQMLIRPSPLTLTSSGMTFLPNATARAKKQTGHNPSNFPSTFRFAYTISTAHANLACQRPVSDIHPPPFKRSNVTKTDHLYHSFPSLSFRSSIFGSRPSVTYCLTQP
jgi:hypothetical protein